MDNKDFLDLVGRRVDGLKVCGHQEYMCFETDAGPIFYRVEGDCCSESWFADLVGAMYLIGGTVQSVTALDLPEKYEGGPKWANTEDGRCRQDYDCVYGYKFTTNKGDAVIAFRNSSNGYYGGELRRVEKVADEVLWTELTEDWSA